CARHPRLGSMPSFCAAGRTGGQRLDVRSRGNLESAHHISRVAGVLRIEVVDRLYAGVSPPNGLRLAPGDGSRRRPLRGSPPLEHLLDLPYQISVVAASLVTE